MCRFDPLQSVQPVMVGHNAIRVSALVNSVGSRLRRDDDSFKRQRCKVKIDKSFRSIAVILISSVGLCWAEQAAANKNNPSKVAASAPPPSSLIWPLPPDPPRIRWVAQYTDLIKVKQLVARKSGWLDKITGTKALDEKLELRKPYGVTTDQRGRIYIADTQLQIVFVIDPKARSVERREGSSRAPMVMPVGVAVDADDRLFVSDAVLHSVICFNPAGAPIAHFGAAVLGRPGGIAIDRQRRRLYVVDAKESRVAVFDTGSLKFLQYFGGPGKPGQHEHGTFLTPTNAAVDRQGNLYVADTGNYRVQVLDPTGKFVRVFGAQGDAPGEFIRPKGIAIDSEGHVYVADAEFNNFQILTPEGRPLLAVGTLGGEPGQFALVAGLYIDSEDRIYTTEMFQGRVQVFQYISQPVSAEEKGVSRRNNQ
jgi:DNA-binding beta-propeller fold protein YncE